MGNSSAEKVNADVAITGNGELFSQPVHNLEEEEEYEETQETDLRTLQKLGKTIEYKWDIYWQSVLFFSCCHLGAIYAIYLVFTTAKFATLLFALFYSQITYLGVTAGVHRLWSHRAFKATWQLRLMLMLMQTATLQRPVYAWVRDHRVHHKYTDTSADPYCSARGFFFAHFGWLLIRKHPDVRSKGNDIDMSDINNDSILMFQKKYYWTIVLFVWGLLPTAVPWYFWNENWWSSFFIATVLRYMFSSHMTSLINSAAHVYGYRPYDNNISAAQNKLVSYLTLGEGWHNYHHVFPWDYKAAELPTFDANWTVSFIHLMANIGWAYDLKTVPMHIVAKRAIRTGDRSHGHVHAEDDDNCDILHRKNK